MLGKILKAALLIFAGVDLCEADETNQKRIQLTDRMLFCRYGETFDNRLGKCVDICLTKNCDLGYYCQRGQCKKFLSQCRINRHCAKSHICKEINDVSICVPGCSSVKCPDGQTCVHGHCLLITQCKDPRPNDSTCPKSTLRGSRVCIQDQYEIYREYGKECEICKDKQVMEYNKVECRPRMFY